jgi:aspartyl-tRNA(Asn)/glutamyl-tRNA(Gln) amidotransferase subunit C
MKLSRADVERIARLAQLHVDEDQLPQLTAQIGRIIEYVSQLETVETEAEAATWPAQTPPQPLRPDVVQPADLARKLESFAPAMQEALFVVPRLAGMEDE